MDDETSFVLHFIPFSFLLAYNMAVDRAAVARGRLEPSHVLIEINISLLVFWGLSRILFRGRLRNIAYFTIVPVALSTICRIVGLHSLLWQSLTILGALAKVIWLIGSAAVTSICQGLVHRLSRVPPVYGPPRNERSFIGAKIFGSIVIVLLLCFFHQAQRTAKGSSTFESASGTSASASHAPNYAPTIPECASPDSGSTTVMSGPSAPLSSSPTQGSASPAPGSAPSAPKYASSPKSASPASERGSGPSPATETPTSVAPKSECTSSASKAASRPQAGSTRPDTKTSVVDESSEKSTAQPDEPRPARPIRRQASSRYSEVPGESSVRSREVPGYTQMSDEAGPDVKTGVNSPSPSSFEPAQFDDANAAALQSHHSLQTSAPRQRREAERASWPLAPLRHSRSGMGRERMRQTRELCGIETFQRRPPLYSSLNQRRIEKRQRTAAGATPAAAESVAQEKEARDEYAAGSELGDVKIEHHKTLGRRTLGQYGQNRADKQNRPQRGRFATRISKSPAGITRMSHKTTARMFRQAVSIRKEQLVKALEAGDYNVIAFLPWRNTQQQQPDAGPAALPVYQSSAMSELATTDSQLFARSPDDSLEVMQDVPWELPDLTDDSDMEEDAEDDESRLHIRFHEPEPDHEPLRALVFAFDGLGLGPSEPDMENEDEGIDYMDFQKTGAPMVVSSTPEVEMADSGGDGPAAQDEQRIQGRNVDILDAASQSAVNIASPAVHFAGLPKPSFPWLPMNNSPRSDVQPDEAIVIDDDDDQQCTTPSSGPSPSSTDESQAPVAQTSQQKDRLVIHSEIPILTAPSSDHEWNKHEEEVEMTVELTGHAIDEWSSLCSKWSSSVSLRRGDEQELKQLIVATVLADAEVIRKNYGAENVQLFARSPSVFCDSESAYARVYKVIAPEMLEFYGEGDQEVQMLQKELKETLDVMKHLAKMGPRTLELRHCDILGL